VREFQRLEHTFTELADNAQWAVDNHDKSLHATSGSTGTSKSKGRKPCSVGASNSWSPRCVVLAGFKRAHGWELTATWSALSAARKEWQRQHRFELFVSHDHHYSGIAILAALSELSNNANGVGERGGVIRQ
jgi:hypothetical protein